MARFTNMGYNNLLPYTLEAGLFLLSTVEPLRCLNFLLDLIEG